MNRPRCLSPDAWLGLAAGLLLATACGAVLAAPPPATAPPHGLDGPQCPTAAVRHHLASPPDEQHCGGSQARWRAITSAPEAQFRRRATSNPFALSAADPDTGIELADRDQAAKGQRQGGNRRDGKDWKRLSPEQRKQLERRKHRFEALSPQEQQRLREARERFQRLPPEERERLRGKWRDLPPEERRRWQQTQSEAAD